MLKRIVEFVRRKNRARLERRQLAKAAGQPPKGWLARVAYQVRAKNHARLAHRRAQRGLLASLAANDTAMLEAMVFLLKAAREDERARAQAQVALEKRLQGVEERVDAGVRLVTARLEAIEARARAPARSDDTAPHVPVLAPARTPASGVNGDQRTQAQLARGSGPQPQPAAAEVSEPGDKRTRRS